MILALPLRPLPFQVAWLLFLLPPLAGFFAPGLSETLELRVALGLRLLLAAMVILPLFRWSFFESGARPRRLMKELRLQLPGFMVAMLVPGFLSLAGQSEIAGFSVVGACLGWLMMGATSFGAESEQKTLAGLLAQPLSRTTIYLEKSGVLAALLAIATANLGLTLCLSESFRFNLGDFLEVASVALLAFCGGPLFSLATRSTLAGLIFTLAAPALLWLMGSSGIQILYHLLFPGEAPSELWLEGLFKIGGPAYLIATLVLGWITFQRLQVRDSGASQRSDATLHPLSRPVDRLVARFLPAASPTAQLVRKEIRLQVVPWLVALLMVGLWILWLALRQFASSDEWRAALNQAGVLGVFAGILGFLALLVTGATAIAEERELGTLEWQLSQPASLRRQWWVKLGVAAALGIGLGVLLPAALWSISFWTELKEAWAESKGLGIVAAATAGVIVAVLAVSVYASSIARNTMKATAAATAIAAGLIGTGSLIAAWGQWIIEQSMGRLESEWGARRVEVPAWAPSEALLHTLAIVSIGGLVVLLAVALLGFARKNFARARIAGSAVGVQLAILLVGCLAWVALSGGLLANLAMRQLQARWAENEANLRVALVQSLTEAARQNRLWPELYPRFGLAAGASAEALAAAVIEARGSERAFSELSALLWMQQRPGGSALVPDDVAERYGFPAPDAALPHGKAIPKTPRQ